ncbi:MAG: PepSY-associated TM helix domain-containing protein [Bacteroidota bacterium]
MKLRRINRAVHRDLGYFFFGMCIIYGLSGIALNHRHHWNPNFIIKQTEFSVQLNSESEEEMDWVNTVLTEINEEENYKTHLVSGDNMRIFINGGTVNVNLSSGQGMLETVRKRPVFNEINFLHYNTPRKLWTWFSDFFAVGLILLAITGLFILKGKNGFQKRGVYFVSVGILIPVLLLYFYLSV